MIRSIRSVFSYELRRNVVRKSFLFTAFGIPALGFLLFFGVQLLAQRENESAEETLTENAIAPAEVGYVDLTGLFTDPLGLILFDNQDQAHDALESGQIKTYYVIAADYVETGNVLQVIPRFSMDGINADNLLLQVLYSRFVQGIDPQIALRLTALPAFERVRIDRAARTANEAGEVVKDEDADFGLVYGFAIIFLFALFGTNAYLMQSVIEEKENRVIEILMSSVRPFHLLAGKILALGLLGIIQMAAWLGTVLILSSLASRLTDVPSSVNFLARFNVSPDTLIILFCYFVFGYLFYAAGYGAVGALSVSMSQGPNYALVFILPVMIPLMIIQVFADSPNAAVPVILSLVPFTSPIAMVMRLAITSVPFFQIALSLILLVLLDIAMIWFAGRIFRAQSLLAGQVPRLREIPGLLRG